MEIIIGSFLVLLGTLAMSLCLREMLFAITSKRWQPVDAVFREVDLTPDDGEQDRYHATVVYTYRIAGQAFSGTRIRFGSVSSFAEKGDARLHLRQLRVGQPCTVFVDPSRPARAVLLPGLTSWSVIPAIVACLPIGMGAEILLRVP